MMKTNINDYLEQLLPPSMGWIQEMEREAIEDNIPIMDRVSMQFVNQIIRLAEPKQILEIGTAIGYSALRMLEAFPSATITTIERDEERYKRAKQLIEKQEKDNHIQLMYGDALEVLTSLQTTGNEFDVAFIDAAKGQYQSFFEKVDPMIRSGGIIISDNVLFRGLVASGEEVDKKYRSLVKNLRLYNKWLMNHSNYESSMIPIGDGVTLSIKKQ